MLGHSLLKIKKEIKAISPSSSQSDKGICCCRCLVINVGLGELNIGGGGIGPISLKGIGGSGSSDNIRVF